MTVLVRWRSSPERAPNADPNAADGITVVLDRTRVPSAHQPGVPVATPPQVTAEASTTYTVSIPFVGTWTNIESQRERPCHAVDTNETTPASRRILVVLCAVLLLGAVAIAVDVGRAVAVTRSAQNSADAVALAMAQGLCRAAAASRRPATTATSGPARPSATARPPALDGRGRAQQGS